MPDDSEVQSHYSLYLCILVSGLIEFSLREFCTYYVEKNIGNFSNNVVAKRIVKHVERNIKEFQNAKMDKVYQLLGSLDSDWEDEIRRISDGEITAAVNSIVTTRHAISHGRDTNITFSVVQQYYIVIKKLIATIFELVNDHTRSRG